MTGPQIPKRGTGAKNGFPYVLPVQRLCNFFQGKEDKPFCGEPGTIPLGGKKCQEADLTTADGFLRAWRAEQVETELLGKSYRDTACISV